jgi:hypothetical protein
MRVEKEEKVLSKINIENVFSCNDLYKKWHRRNWIYKIKLRWKNEIIKVYCDMKTSWGGWTLVLTSAKSGWNGKSIYSNDIWNPSIDKNYSILNKADFIKTINWCKWILKKLRCLESKWKIFFCF